MNAFAARNAIESAALSRTIDPVPTRTTAPAGEVGLRAWWSSRTKSRSAALRPA